MTALARVQPQEADAALAVRGADEIETLIGYRKEAIAASSDSRVAAENDEDYYNNIQLTSTEIRTLKRRGQPTGTFNMIRRKVDYVLGIERKTRTDPKCFPRTMEEEDAAEAWTDALRYAAERANFAKIKSQVSKNVYVNGFGGSYVGVKKTKDGKIDITVIYVPWARLWFDPHSAEADFSDARYVGFDTWYDIAEAEKKFPQGADALAATPGLQFEDDGGTYEDKPRYGSWYDSKRKRVRVSECYYRDPDGQWTYACFTRGGELQSEQVVTYLDADQEPECPLQLVSCYVDRDNNRHGIVRDLVPVQDEINKRRQKALHQVTMRQARVGRGAAGDAKKISSELAKPDGLVVADKDEFEILNTNDQAAANLGMLESAKADMQLMGPNSAAQGKDPRDLSGRAQALMTEGALIELEPVKDNLRDWQLRIMRQMKNRIRQFWNAPMWVRVTDDEENVKFVGLNQPMTAGEALADKIKKEERDPTPDEIAFLQSPQAQQVVGTKNDVASTDVDIILDEQPSVVTLQAETFEALTKMAAAPDSGITGEDLITASPLPGSVKRKIEDRRKKREKAGPPPPPPEVQAQIAIAQQKAQGDQAKLQADLQMKQMELQQQTALAQQQADQQAQQTAAERQKAEDERAFRQIEMQFELRKMELQMQLEQQKAAVATQANAVRVHEINNPPPPAGA